MSAARTVVILKSVADAALEEMIAAQGFTPLYEPIMTIAPLAFDPPAAGSTLVFTSAHAVRIAAGMLPGRDHPVFTVGDETAAMARDAGFETVVSAGGDAQSLQILLQNKLNTHENPAFYLRGADIAHDITGILGKNGVNLWEITVYAANPAQNLSENLRRALDNRDINAILFYSARGAAIFTELVRRCGMGENLRGTKALCISDAVIKSVSVLPFCAFVVAECPGRHGMMTLAENISIS